MYTYCKKDCEICEFKETLNCSGCKNGFVTDEACDIAQCCIEKGHDECESCNHSSNCYKLRSKEYIPDKIIRSREERQQKEQRLKTDAVILEKNLNIIFWLFIPAMIAGLFSENSLFTAPLMVFIGSAVNIVCSFLYSIALYKMSPVNSRYKTASICGFVGTFASILVGPMEEMTILLLIIIPAAIAALVGEYNEYTANSEVLFGVITSFHQNGKVSGHGI